jgi:hypothetical protein
MYLRRVPPENEWGIAISRKKEQRSRYWQGAKNRGSGTARQVRSRLRAFVFTKYEKIVLLDSATALRLAEAAADREDAVDKHPVTPGETLPARELFAEMLLIEGRPADAFEQYRIVLAGSPNRANALLGAARAAAGSGETDVAADYYQTLLDQTASGDLNRGGLQEAREYIANPG